MTPPFVAGLLVPATGLSQIIKKASEDGQDFEVTYMGYGTEGSATITTLRQITRSPRPVPEASAVKGLECRALYVGDGT